MSMRGGDELLTLTDAGADSSGPVSAPSLDIASGLMTVDSSGNIDTNGNATVDGYAVVHGQKTIGAGVTYFNGSLVGLAQYHGEVGTLAASATGHSATLHFSDVPECTTAPVGDFDGGAFDFTVCVVQVSTLTSTNLTVFESTSGTAQSCAWTCWGPS
jgi:hypothetical protein